MHDEGRVGKLVEIQSITKTRTAGWVFSSGAGTRNARGIELKFKINRPGDIEIPILVAYLYDRNKKPVKKIDKVLVNQGTRIVLASGKRFKGKRTHRVIFPYENETQFKYYLVVAGTRGDLSAHVEPNARIEDFAFEEKSYF